MLTLLCHIVCNWFDCLKKKLKLVEYFFVTLRSASFLLLFKIGMEIIKTKDWRTRTRAPFTKTRVCVFVAQRVRDNHIIGNGFFFLVFVFGFVFANFQTKKKVGFILDIFVLILVSKVSSTHTHTHTSRYTKKCKCKLSAHPMLVCVRLRQSCCDCNEFTRYLFFSFDPAHLNSVFKIK